MAPALELALGTLKLEDTDLSVDSELSAQLLPLWQLLNELNSSGSAAPQEITAVVETIQSTMTPEQIKAITAMHLTQADIATASQSGGSSTAAGTTAANSGAQVVSADAGPIMGGDMPAGGMPPDAGGMPLDGGLPGGLSSSGSTSSNTASKSQSSSSSTAATSLIEQVIELLQRKIQS